MKSIYVCFYNEIHKHFVLLMRTEKSAKKWKERQEDFLHASYERLPIFED